MTRQVSRQTFIRGALAVAAVGASASCRTTTPGSATTGPTTTSTAPKPDWASLRNVVLPTDADYAAAKKLFNSRFDDTMPVAVVAVTSTDEVKAAVAFASANGLKVAVRSGGHSYIGDSAPNDVLVIDLRQLGAPTYDAESTLATIPAAAQLDSVQKVLAVHGRSIPSGSCPTVGVAGLTLGGGLGADARQWGLSCDALVSATVVLPSGEVVIASASVRDDLFWALRGGGGGHFGVVTSFTFRTFPVADRDVVTLAFAESSAAQAIIGWHTWISAAPRSTWGMVNISGSDSALQCHVIAATAAGDGADAAEGLVAVIGSAPIGNARRTLNHVDFVHYFEGGADATRPRAVVAGSDIIGEMAPAAAQSIVDGISASRASATVVLESLSGAVRDIAPDDTAFPWRRQAACLQWYTEPSSPADIDAATDWLAGAHAAVHSHSVGGYANYLDSDTSPARYFGGNLARLTAVRQKYDPDAVMFSSLNY